MTDITSVELGATGRYIDLGSPAVLDDLAQMTVLTYSRPSSTGPQYPYFFGKTPSGSVYGPRLFINHNGGSPYFVFASDSSGLPGYPELRSPTGVITYDQWQHIGVTWTRGIASSGIELFHGQGADVTSVAGTSGTNGGGSINTDAANPLYLMNRYGLGREFKGDYPYTAFWSRILTLTELRNAQNNGPLAEPTGLILLWSNQQDYSTNALTPSSRSTFVAGTLPPNVALGGGADTTAPVLTSPTGTQTGSATATGTVSTDEGNGTLFAVVTTSATSPSVAQIQAGQDHTGASAAFAVGSGSGQAVSATGTQNVSATGLTASTAYYWHYQQQDTATNDSTVVTSAQFTTTAAVVKGATITLHNSTTPQASITNILALWWDATSPTGAPVYETATASTDGSGVMTLDLEGDTALAVGGTGFLMLYKVDGTDHRDSLVFAGQVDVVDIS